MEAWFKADAAVSVTNGAAVAAGSVTVGATTAESVNNFTITPSVVTGSRTIAYTKADGTTYVSIPDGNGGWTEKAGQTTSPKAFALELKCTVTYSGDLTDKALVKNLFVTSCASVTLTVTCDSVSGTTVAGEALESDVRFVSSLAANQAGDSSITKATSAAPFDAAWNSATSSGELVFGTIYVALTGSNSLVVDAENSPVYSLLITPTHTDPAP